ncbi:MAG: molybdenum cofactor biosynthesis protein MoaE [Chthoniobacterales bacterium]
MASNVLEVSLSDTPLVTPEKNSPPETGGVVDFWGVVRQTENGGKISGIKYEAHRPMAEHQLHAIAEAAAARFDLHEIRIRHRLGFVSTGEASLFVRVGCQHRAEAFRATQWVVDELKKRAPIWKHPKPEVAL